MRSQVSGILKIIFTMAFKTLTILEKSIGDPLDSVLTTRRTAAPQIIQPTYTFDPSDMYDFFIPCVSVGTDFYWESGYLEVSTGFAIGVFLKEASIGNGFVWSNGLLNTSVDKTYIDGSLFQRDTSIAWNTLKNINQDTSISSLNDWLASHQASIVDLILWQYDQDASILILNNWNVAQDLSINYLYGQNFLRESSVCIDRDFQWNETDHKLDVSTLNIDDYFYSKYYIDQWLSDISTGVNLSYYATNASMYDYVDVQISDLLTDASILSYGYATNASVGLAFGAYATNASINTASFATNASINNAGFLKSADASTTYLKINDASTNYIKSLVSLNLKNSAYIIQNSDLNSVIEASGTFTISLPNNLSAGFQTTILNIDNGFITLNASTLLTTDSSVVLRSRYAGATAIHKGSGIWYAFGNLQ